MGVDQKRLEREREALIAQITGAFRAVGRAGGVTWHEADVIDDYGTDEERTAARELDTERNWMELLDPARWNTAPGSQFSFLDPIGFRYYLAPAMIRCIQGDANINLQFHLTLSGGELADYVSQGWPPSRWAPLDREQKLAIGRFLRYMHEVDKLRWAEAPQLGEDVMGWKEAYDSYWRAECEGGPEPKETRRKKGRG